MIGGMEMIVLLVLIGTIGTIALIHTIGKVLKARSEHELLLRGPDPEAIGQLNDAMSEVHTRLSKLEEERDFYRALLEAPKGEGTPGPRGPSAVGPATDETPPHRPRDRAERRQSGFRRRPLRPLLRFVQRGTRLLPANVGRIPP